MLRRDLIMDVGMHDGTDTAYYLAKGFNVVAVEANPALVTAARRHFASEIEDGRLTIIGAAIAEEKGLARLAVCDEQTIWSTLDPDYVKRNSRKFRYRYVEVPTLSFEELLLKHGVPYYLKIDIEGMDMLPVRALRGVRERPQYLSIESDVSSSHATRDRVDAEFAELWALGYRRFQFVNQRKLPRAIEPNPPLEGSYVGERFSAESSGPFGRELGGHWLTIRQARAQAMLLRSKHNIGGYGGRWRGTPVGLAYAVTRRLVLRRAPSWYDLHARLGC
jgi:FkbM family methyltransferase